MPKLILLLSILSITAMMVFGQDPDVDCQIGNGEDYSGIVSKTISGRTCQKWSSQSPHHHPFGNLGDNNYCRNPYSTTGVWCYTTDPDKRSEFCDVPICEGPTEPPTEPITEPPTEPITEPPTESPTEPPTEPPTEAPTEPPTEAPTEPPTETPTQPPTETPTEPPTETPTETPTEAPTEPPTETPTEPPTEAHTEPPTETPTEAPTETPTEPPTEAPTEAPTTPENECACSDPRPGTDDNHCNHPPGFKTCNVDPDSPCENKYCHDFENCFSVFACDGIQPPLVCEECECLEPDQCSDDDDPWGQCNTCQNSKPFKICRVDVNSKCADKYCTGKKICYAVTACDCAEEEMSLI